MDLPPPGSGNYSNQSLYKYNFSRLDHWRSHPAYTKSSIFTWVPGFIPAVGLFATYCVVEQIYNRLRPAHDHEEHHWSQSSACK